jgi:hypothetical protein
MGMLLVMAAAAAFAVLVAGAKATDDRPAVLLCVSSRTCEDGRLSTAEQHGPSCP